MRTARNAALGGVTPDSMDARLMVLGIQPDAGKDNIQGAAHAEASGQRVVSRRREYLDVRIILGIWGRKEDRVARSLAFEHLIAWAQRARDGAWLTIDSKPGRRLWVRVQQLPAEGDQWNWTAQYTVVLRAWERPWWEELYGFDSRVTGSSCSGQARVAGTEETAADVTYKNTSGSACTTLVVNIGNRRMTFSGLDIASGETFAIDHREDGMLRIRIRSTAGEWRSALAARVLVDGGGVYSANDLTCLPGIVPYSCSAQRSGEWKIQIRGRFA